MEREQKEEREGGGGEERKSLQLSPYILPNAVRPRTGGITIGQSRVSENDQCQQLVNRFSGMIRPNQYYGRSRR